MRTIFTMAFRRPGTTSPSYHDNSTNDAMGRPTSEDPIAVSLDSVLGYLNFSSGNHDARFFANFDELFRQYSRPFELLRELLESDEHCVARSNKRANAETTVDDLLDRNDLFEPEKFSWSSLAADCSDEPWIKVHHQLIERLDWLEKNNETFRDSTQVRDVVAFVFEDFLPALLKFHRDQLFHQRTEVLFNSFFVARAFETTLGNIALARADRLSTVLEQFNDHLGHRPVATLESQKIEPYPHEWIRPLPIWVREVGPASSPYEGLSLIHI